MKGTKYTNSKNLILAFLFMLLPLLGKSQELCGKKYNNFIPDSTTAVKVADAILTPLYGSMTNERPLRAELLGDSIWFVYGTLPEHSLGGVAMIKLRKSDGKVLSVCHGK